MNEHFVNIQQTASLANKFEKIQSAFYTITILHNAFTMSAKFQRNFSGNDWTLCRLFNQSAVVTR